MVLKNDMPVRASVSFSSDSASSAAAWACAWGWNTLRNAADDFAETRRTRLAGEEERVLLLVCGDLLPPPPPAVLWSLLWLLVLDSTVSCEGEGGKPGKPWGTSARVVAVAAGVGCCGRVSECGGASVSSD